MTVPPGEPRRDPPVSPLDAARRYPAPHRRWPIAPDQSAPGETGGGDSLTPDSGPPALLALKRVFLTGGAPRVLGILGIVCAFLLAPAGLVLGIAGHYLAHRRGESVKIPRLAWILSVVVPILAILLNIAARQAFRVSPY